MGRAPDGGAPDGEGARAGHARGWGRGRRAASGGRGVSDEGASDGEGARAGHTRERAVRSGCFLRARAARASARSGSFCECVAWVSLIRRGPGYLLTSNGLTLADRS
jgi:hypothetical protein